MKVFNAANTLLVEGFCVGSFVEIEISSENLITTLSAQHHLDTHCLDLPTQQVHRGTCTHGGHIVGFKVVDDIGNSVQALLHCEDILVVYGAEIVGDLTGSEEIW